MSKPRQVFLGFIAAVIAFTITALVIFNKSDQAQHQGVVATKAAKTANAKATSVGKQIIVVRHKTTLITRTLAGKPGGLGPQGSRGLRGVTGATGLQGERGLPGADAPAVSLPDLATLICDLHHCDAKDGADGKNGADGKDGKDGAPGLPGATGPAGADGAQGAPGAQGATGPEPVSVPATQIGADGVTPQNCTATDPTGTGNYTCPPPA